jgi:hypothetical protein
MRAGTRIYRSIEPAFSFQTFAWRKDYATLQPVSFPPLYVFWTALDLSRAVMFDIFFFSYHSSLEGKKKGKFAPRNLFTMI